MDLGENVLVAGVTIHNRIDGNTCQALELSSRLTSAILSLRNLEGDTVKALKIGNARDVPVFDIRFDSYIGCFIDSSERDLTYFVGELSVNGQINCIQACQSEGYQFAGTQSSQECWCGNSYGKYGADPNGCTMPCANNPMEMCGNGWRNSVYKTLPATPVSPTPKPASSAVTTKPTTPYYCLESKLSPCLGTPNRIWYARFWSTLSSNLYGRGTPPYRLVVDDYCGIVVYDKMDIAIYDDNDDNDFNDNDGDGSNNNDICDFCGGGRRGNGNCPSLGNCCSSSGWCGVSVDYCGVGRARNCPCGGGNIGNGICPNTGECCSPGGWCGTGSLYCVSNPCGGGYRGNGICPTSGDCCSPWGWCGTSAAHCVYVRPTSSPTITMTSSPTISASPSWCTGDTPNWEDGYGYGCNWYEENDKPGCPNYGWRYRGNMGVADDNCCYCFGTAVSIICLDIHSHRFYGYRLKMYLCTYSRFLPPFPLHLPP